MTLSRVDKSVRQGSPLLIPRDEWCDVSEIQGHDPDVLQSPTIERAFQRICEHWKPQHQTALISLCTSSRPYSKARKWKRYTECFGKKADLIICSNGGIIPIAYERCFPYLNYDAHGEAKYDDLYVEIVGKRMWQFFSSCRYRYIIFNFRHNMRNVRCANVVGPALKAQGLIEDFAILPTQEQYELARADGLLDSGFKRHPELHPIMFQPLVEQVARWR